MSTRRLRSGLGGRYLIRRSLSKQKRLLKFRISFDLAGEARFA